MMIIRHWLLPSMARRVIVWRRNIVRRVLVLCRRVPKMEKLKISCVCFITNR